MTTKSTPRSDIQMLGQLPEENENVASSRNNVRTVQGGVQNDDEIKYRHTIGGRSCIIIEMGQIFIINHLKMKLFFHTSGYFIEISTDQKNWERIINYSSSQCCLMQNLYFPSKPVKYIKIVGTWSHNEFFQVGTFEAYYRENIPETRNGVVVPKEKVKYLGYWLDGSYLITLNQPYYIDSMRFRIGLRNSNLKYKFYIETGSNYWDYEEVADKRDEFVNGCQTFRFTSKLISFIRITTTGCNYPAQGVNSFYQNVCPFDFECPLSV